MVSGFLNRVGSWTPAGIKPSNSGREGRKPPSWAPIVSLFGPNTPNPPPTRAGPWVTRPLGLPFSTGANWFLAKGLNSPTNGPPGTGGPLGQELGWAQSTRRTPLDPSPPGLATVIGIIGGLVVVPAIVMIDKLRIDDPVGAISVHGVVGICGLLAAAFTNPAGSLIKQCLGIAVIFSWSFGCSLILWLAIKATIGIRVSEEEEFEAWTLPNAAWRRILSSARGRIL